MVRVREELIAAGEILSEALKARVLALGPDAFEDLLAVFLDEELVGDDDPGGGFAPVHAATLLGELGDARAVAPLLEEYLWEDWDTYVHNAAALALPKLGAAALEAVLAAWQATDDWDTRGHLGIVLGDLGLRDERILDALVACLPHDAERTAGSLGSYGDPRALPALLQAYDACAPALGDDDDIWRTGFALRELRHAIVELGGALDEARQLKFDASEALLRPMAEALHADPEDSGIDPALLADLAATFDGSGRARPLWNLRGYMVALVCGPSVPTPGAWMAAAATGPLDAARDQVRLVDRLLALYTETARALDASFEAVCPEPSDGEAVAQFCAGYVEAADTDGEWLKLAPAPQEMAVVRILAGQGDPPGGGDPEEAAARRRTFHSLLPQLLSIIDAELQPARAAAIAALEAASQPFRRTTPKVGRNDPCPCGSGKKYKRCCGAS